MLGWADSMDNLVFVFIISMLMLGFLGLAAAAAHIKCKHGNIAHVLDHCHSSRFLQTYRKWLEIITRNPSCAAPGTVCMIALEHTWAQQVHMRVGLLKLLLQGEPQLADASLGGTCE